MREMLGVTGAIVGAGLHEVALVTTAASGATHGVVGHLAPEALGGPLAADNDVIVIDPARGRIDLEIGGRLRERLARGSRAVSFRCSRSTRPLVRLPGAVTS